MAGAVYAVGAVNSLIGNHPDEAFELTGVMLAAGTACTLPFVIQKLGIDYKSLPDEARDELEALYGAEPMGFARKAVYSVRAGLYAAKWKRSLGAHTTTRVSWHQGEWDVTNRGATPFNDSLDREQVMFLERVGIDTPKWDSDTQQLVI